MKASGTATNPICTFGQIPGPLAPGISFCERIGPTTGVGVDVDVEVWVKSIGFRGRGFSSFLFGFTLESLGQLRAILQASESSKRRRNLSCRDGGALKREEKLFCKVVAGGSRSLNDDDDDELRF